MKGATVPPNSSSSLSTLRASDVMQRQLITVHAGDSLPEVERVLADSGITGVPVLHEDGRILGVLSMADLVRSHAEEDRNWQARDADFDDEEAGEDEDDFGPEPPSSLCA